MNYETTPTKERSGRDASRDMPSVIAFPPLIYLGALLLGLGLRHAWKWPFLPTSVPALWPRIAGAIVILSGGSLAMWARNTMVHAGTNVLPSQPALKIVTAGPFRFTRNPIYLGNTLVYLGLALIINSTWLIVLFVPMVLVLHQGVILREERYLEAKFGQDYVSYKAQVHRWL